MRLPSRPASLVRPLPLPPMQDLRTAPPRVLPRGEGLFQNVLGDRQTVKLTGADTGGVFALVESENPPGVGIPPHIHHAEDEVFYVIEGRVAFTVDGAPVEAKAGTTVWLPQGTPHSFTVVGDRPARMLTLLFPAGLEALFAELATLDGPPDPGALMETCAPYGIEFLPPPDAS